MTTALEGGEGSVSRPGRSLPPGKQPVPIVQEAKTSSGQMLISQSKCRKCVSMCAY